MQIDASATSPATSPAFNDTTVLVTDVGQIYSQYRQWREHLPTIEPFYAVKCNPAPVILETLVRASAGFDIASAWEVDQVRATGADPAKVIFANPAKPVSHLSHTAAMGVRLLTFDLIGELRKIRAHHPNPLLVLRMAIGAGHARMALDTVGCSARAQCSWRPSSWDSTLSASHSMLEGGALMRAYTKAVIKARSVFTMAAELGFQMTLLDVGGGDSTFADMATALRDSIAREFATMPVRVIAELRRYFVAHTCHVAVNVIGQPTPDAPPHQHLRLHEGAFSLFERGSYPRGPYVIVKDGEIMADPHKYVGNGQVFPTTCFGQT
ncbi:hypothetical protein AMAG_14409 [Allomyces macrogynus ATCC 38327]|uniref:Orn/DAP/Arg decarboxylase 2 N-terminal domain-containing protein n=1 Tax=Allomyces macrogynus (strain ATCC 38327) TaxID=578462 RepID=A0A0L0T634_ALLM3|nr:hypothetical protein AMAG_14409 [Allomyces macrogynus ATCC 38327]|eukprot:KNE70258.1 hypothetical protein AMAG_14409 [Allomyces macrogynus ATCC 38327]